MDIDSVDRSQIRAGWLRGVSRALPAVMGYIPIGFATGVLAQKAGISTFNTLLMSIIVYAGSSQLIAIGLIGALASPVTIIITTFIVNLRHVLLAAAVSPRLKGWRKGELAAFAYELTDETFGLHITTPGGTLEKAAAFGVNVTAQFSWVLGTWLGIVAGQAIQDVKPFALDYALAAMFIALLVMQVKNLTQVGVAVVAGGLSVALLLAGLDQWSVIVATVIAATAGLLTETWTKKPSS